VIALLGSGGMGEVYRAKDTRPGREVAIKVLPHAFAKDADRLRRFEQEARTIAALNHPNILGIHDIGTHEGRPYLVSDLLVGGPCARKSTKDPSRSTARSNTRRRRQTAAVRTIGISRVRDF
jgi:serine/threonine protein kinase